MGALGRALIKFWGGGRELSTYDRKGWHAQLSQLTETPKGYRAMEAAGIDITPKTLIKWLSKDGGREDFSPTPANVRKIQNAYNIRRGKWNPANETHKYEISGIVKIGSDERDRGGGRYDPLRIDGTQGKWRKLREAYESGELTEDDAEEWFIEDVIEEDIGTSTEPFQFPGAYYTIG